MKRNKSGISLIVLVITIIVMIILAGSVIISLSNSGIIGKANEAVDANNLKQVQQLASLAWSEAYMDKMTDNTVDLETRVEEALENNKVDLDKYVVTVTDTGVEVLEATLGNLIKSAADYGKVVDYKAGASYTYTYTPRVCDPIDTWDCWDGPAESAQAVISEWQVFYEDKVNGYVFLIANGELGGKSIDSGVSLTDLTAAEKTLYSKFQLGADAQYVLGSTENGLSTYNTFMIANLIKNYGHLANKELYGDYVIGSLGGPTIEMFVAAWNEKGYSPKLSLTLSTEYEYGYLVNNEAWGFGTRLIDEFYLPADYSYYLASPGSGSNVGSVWCLGHSAMFCDYGDMTEVKIRPVVCLSADIPAKPTADGYTLMK